MPTNPQTVSSRLSGVPSGEPQNRDNKPLEPLAENTPPTQTATFLDKLPPEATPLAPSIGPLVKQLAINQILQTPYTQGNKTAATRIANNNKWIIRQYRLKDNLYIQRLK